MNPLTSVAANILYGVVGNGIFAGIIWLVTRSRDSVAPAVAGLASFTLFSGGMALWVIGYRYARMLAAGGNPPEDEERQAYDRLREDLAHPETTPRLYGRWVKGALRWADRFFDKDSGPERSLWPRALGLKVPAPLWTPSSYDRCLLLALIYPVLALFLIWVFTGKGGLASDALGLKQSDFAHRAASLVSILSICFASSKLSKAGGWKSNLLWTSIGFVAVAVAGAVAGAVAVSGAIAFALLFDWTKSHNRDGVFLTFFTLAFSAGTLAGPHFFPSKDGPLSLLLFFGLFTLLNAPFDWTSLGLTRVLLRLGLQKGGYWPLYIAILDTLAAVLVIAMLALVMLLGTQAYSDIEQASGAAITLPLPALFHQLDKNALAWENWWLYVTLLTTLFPSIVNLALGSVSWLRGRDWFNARILRHMHAGRAVVPMHRPGIIFALTVQVFLGYVLAVVVQIGLFVALIAFVLPHFGLNLRDIAEAIYAWDLPRAAWHMVFGAPISPHAHRTIVI